MGIVWEVFGQNSGAKIQVFKSIFDYIAKKFCPIFNVICSICNIFLSKLQNIFVLIALNGKSYLSNKKGGK